MMREAPLADWVTQEAEHVYTLANGKATHSPFLTHSQPKENISASLYSSRILQSESLEGIYFECRTHGWVALFPC